MCAHNTNKDTYIYIVCVCVYIYIYKLLAVHNNNIYIYHEVYSTSNLQIFCSTPCALHHLLCFAGSDDMHVQTMSKKVYIYMLRASAGTYTCFDPLTQRTRVACSWDLCVCVILRTNTFIYIYTLVYCLALKQFQALESKQNMMLRWTLRWAACEYVAYVCAFVHPSAKPHLFLQLSHGVVQPGSSGTPKTCIDVSLQL